MRKELFWAVMFSLVTVCVDASRGWSQPVEVRKAIEVWFDENDNCRGVPDVHSSLPACIRREILSSQLDMFGYCYGRKNQIGAEMQWHSCRPDSIRMDAIGSREAVAETAAEIAAAFKDGEYGADPDRVRALLWYNIASVFNPAKYVGLRDELLKQVSGVEAQQAEQLAQRCKVSNFRDCK